jgi:hypothetical protein
MTYASKQLEQSLAAALDDDPMEQMTRDFQTQQAQIDAWKENMQCS